MDTSGNVNIEMACMSKVKEQQSSLEMACMSTPWPDPARPGNRFLSIYMCGTLDISGGGIELREPAYVDEHNET
jgi:hypothetical protein